MRLHHAFLHRTEHSLRRRRFVAYPSPVRTVEEFASLGSCEFLV
jgi:hypothetical protein